VKLFIHIDGASRGNPGPSSVGVIIRDSKGQTLREHHRYLGEGTNNMAEYSALKDALNLAKELGATSVKVHSDSQLLVRQFNGQYRVKNARLFSYLVEIQSLRSQFASLELVHVPREQNKDADRLANAALDQARAKF
jgi:ribonuclease HI